MKKQVRDYLILSFASLLVAIGVYFFKFPNNFTYGGISGMSVLLGRIFGLQSTATLNIILDYSLLAIGLLVLGRNFAVRTVARRWAMMRIVTCSFSSRMAVRTAVSLS